MHATRCAGVHRRDKIVKMEGGYHGSYDAVEISGHPDPAAAGPMTRPVALLIPGASWHPSSRCAGCAVQRC
jgi:glutamate-1-semialdehyde aminotransferase